MKGFLKNLTSNRYPFITIALVAIIAFWQISFLQNSLKWDLIDVVLPWRFYLGEALQNHFFPLWNPYQQLGYPIYADLQYPVWSPEAILIAVTTGFSNYTLHGLFIFYLVIAGIGMYHLVFYHTKNRDISTIASVAYLLSGFFVGHGQSMILIIGGAWLPWVLYCYLRFLNELTWKSFLKTCIVLFFMLMSGYQTLSIILFYLLIVFFLFYLVHYFQKYRDRIPRYLLMHLTLGIVVLMMISVLIVLLMQVQPHNTRMVGIDLKNALDGHIPPQGLISWLVPFSSVKNIESVFGPNDASMVNGYFGVIILVFFLMSLTLIKKFSGVQRIWLIFGMFTLIAAFGPYTPVREWLFYYVPLMDMFRMPAVFRIFTIISFILLASFALQHFIKDPIFFRKRLTYITSGILLVLTGLFLWSLTGINFESFTFFKRGYGFYNLLETSSFREHVFINSAINFSILFCFLILIHFKKYQRYLLPSAAMLIFVEMFIAVQLNIYYTAVSNSDPTKIYSYIEQQPKGFPHPGNSHIKDNRDQAVMNPPLWRNTNIFSKKVSPDGYTSFWLDRPAEMLFKMNDFAEAVLDNPAVYLSGRSKRFSHQKNATLHDKVLGISKFPQHNEIVWFDNETFENHSELQDLTPVAASDYAEILKFHPHHIRVKTENSGRQVLTLIQSYYPGWEVYVNGQSSDLLLVNHALMAVIVNEGENIVDFKYRNPEVIYAFAVSHGTFLLLVFSLVFMKFYTCRKCRRFIFVPVILVVVVGWLAFTSPDRYYNRYLLKYNEITEKGKHYHDKYGSDIIQVAKVHRTSYLQEYLDDPEAVFSITSHKGQLSLLELSEILQESNAGFFSLSWDHKKLQVEADRLIRLHFQSVKEEKRYNYYSGTKLYGNRSVSPIEAVYSKVFDFTTPSEFWNIKEDGLDSSQALFGSSAFKITPEIPFSPGFNAAFKSLSDKNTALFRTSVMISGEPGKHAHLALSRERDGVQTDWFAVPLAKFARGESSSGKQTWYKASQIKFFEEVHPEDRFKVFVWNNGDQSFLIDGLSVEVFSYD